MNESLTHTGAELRTCLADLGLQQADALLILQNVHARTLRGWLASPSKRFKYVPGWVIPTLYSSMGRIPHKSVDKFIIGHALGKPQKDGIYLIHTEMPRFLCRVVPVHNFVDKQEGVVFACGNRMMTDFQFFDTDLADVKRVLDHACQVMDDHKIANFKG